MNNAKAKSTQSDDSRDLVSRARELLDQMAKLSTEAGIPVVAYASPDLLVFSKHSREDQAMLVKELEERVELFAGARSEGVNLRDSRQMLWRSMRKAGWVPSSDAFEAIEEHDTVEVYSLQMKQVFRNLEYFRFVSYTLEDIHGGTWYELFARNEEAQKALFDIASRIVSGQEKKTVDVRHLGPQLLQETQSVEKRKFLIDMKVISPVYTDGVLSAFISVNRTTAVE